jgi:glycopeptide antibiotics resistance protein
VVLYLAGLAFFGLMPFDLSLSPALVYEKFATGLVRMGPVPRFHGSVAETLTDIFTEVAVWVPAGFLGRLAVPPSLAGGSARAPAALAWIGCVAVAAGIEALQLLVGSRVVDVSDVTLAAVGAGLGVQLAGRLLRRWPAAGSGSGVVAGGPGCQRCRETYHSEAPARASALDRPITSGDRQDGLPSHVPGRESLAL